VQAASENLSKRDEELEQWATELARREQDLIKRSQDVGRLTNELQRRETDVETLNRVLGSQQLALVKMDHDVVQRTAEYASSQRETLRRQAQKALADVSEERYSGRFGIESPYLSSSSAPTTGMRSKTKVNNWLGESAGTISQQREELEVDLQSSPHKGNPRDSGSSRVKRELNAVDRELYMARRSLLSARGTMSRNEDFRTKTNELIVKETSFMADAALRRSYY
jgi:chromosome segregation ATPase